MLADVLDRIERLDQQAVHLCRQAKFAQALADAADAERLARRHFAAHTVHAGTLNTLAAVRYELGDFEQAEALYREAREIDRHSIGERHPEYARVLCNLAVVCQRIGEYAEAAELYREALEIRGATIGEASPVYATNLNNLAKLYENQGNFTAAEPLLLQALEITRASLGEESSGFGRALLALGELRYAMGQFALAEPALLQAAEIVRRSLGENHPTFAASLSSLGDLFRSTGDLERAEEALQRAGAILLAARGENHPDLVGNLTRLGNLYQESGDWARAEPLLRQALDRVGRARGTANEAYGIALSNLAALSLRMGEPEPAEMLFRQALQVRRTVLGEEHPDVALSLSNVARVMDMQGDSEGASPLYQRALAILRQTVGDEHPAFANCLNDLGAMWERQHRFAEAAEYYQRACAVWRSTHGEESREHAMGLNNLAGVYDALGSFDRAEELYRAACGILERVVGKEHPTFAGCLKNLAGICVARGRAAEAQALMVAALDVDQRLIGNAFACSSESRRMAYLRTLQDDFFTFLSLATKHRPPAAVASALDVVLRRKGLGAEFLVAQRDSVLGGAYPALEPRLRRWLSLRRQIAQKMLAGPGPEGLAAHRALLDEWTSEKNEMEAELARHMPEMKLEQKLRSADRHAVAAALPESSALVEFVWFDLCDFEAVTGRGQPRWRPARYLAFVLLAGRPDDVRMIDLGEAAPIERMIAEFRASIVGEEGRSERDPIPAGPIAGVTSRDPVLRAAVFDKLVPELDGCRRLFLAPDGDLARLPFEVLPCDDDSRLIDQYRISYLVTGRDVLRFGATSARPAARPLVVADPDFDLVEVGSAEERTAPTGPRRQSRDLQRSGLWFDRLPGTRLEGSRIAALLGVSPWMDVAALKGRIRSCRSPRVLHMATHGFFLTDQAHDPHDERVDSAASDADGERLSASRLESPLLRSGLALAGINTWLNGLSPPVEAEDGVLTAEDVSGLDLLDTDLVVLSACETGLGAVQAGEGVFGLRRAFVEAGAKTLVMSLWKVPDEQTGELMEGFYRRVLAGHGRAEALREAQLALKAEYPDPLFWGAFICQGEPASLKAVRA